MQLAGRRQVRDSHTGLRFPTTPVHLHFTDHAALLIIQRLDWKAKLLDVPGQGQLVTSKSNTKRLLGGLCWVKQEAARGVWKTQTMQWLCQKRPASRPCILTRPRLPWARSWFYNLWEDFHKDMYIFPETLIWKNVFSVLFVLCSRHWSSRVHAREVH